ncbi:MAG: hypothetical protein ACD_75C02423G0017 [uncultured bacterium]|nr:MAG: hypothetical protein ACD_75C02423G0017 [uncultured bacterium]
MKRYLRRIIVAAACIVSFAAGATADWSRAESVTAKENLEKLKKTNSCRGCDLSGLTLNRMNLAGADLEGADFSMAKFFLTNLAGANLKNSNLKGATFGGSDLGEADLRGADLRGTSLDGAYLGGTRLDGEFVTAKPYEDIGVTDVEKQIYIDDPGKPKKNPETREVKVAARRDFEEPPPPLAVEQDASKMSSNVSKGGEAASAPAIERQPDAPVVKKVAPVQQAIVEPDEKAEKAEKAETVEKAVGEPVSSKEPVVASAEKLKENNDNAGSKSVVPKSAPKMVLNDGKPPVILQANSKKEISSTPETRTNDAHRPGVQNGGSSTGRVAAKGAKSDL